MLQDTKKCRVVEKAVLSETAVIQQQVEDAGMGVLNGIFMGIYTGIWIV